MDASLKIKNDEIIPLKFYLCQNYPNPFRGKTKIKYCIAYLTNVKIALYNLDGKMIQKLLDQKQEAGTYEIIFNPANIRFLVPGTYFYRMNAGDYLSEKEMTLV